VAAVNLQPEVAASCSNKPPDDNRWDEKTVFVDSIRQVGFPCSPRAALYVPLAERIVPLIAALTRYAAAHGDLPVISTTGRPPERTRLSRFINGRPHGRCGPLGKHKAGSNAAREKTPS